MAVDHTAMKAGPLRATRVLSLLLSAASVLLCATLFADGADLEQPRQGSLESARARGPARVISLIPAVTEIIFALGAGESVVGVSSFDRYPPEVKTRTRVGGLVDPDFERILSLRPDLVIVYGSQVDLIARLDRAGVPMFKYEHAGLADVSTTIRSLGARLERGKEAAVLAGRLEYELSAVRKQVAGRPRPRTAVVFDREPGALRGIFASAGVGFMHDMLETAGGDDVFGDVKRQNVQATVEILLSRAPEVIVEVHGGDPWPADRIARERNVWNALTSVPAVRTGRVHILVDDRLSIPGPRVAEGARLLAGVLHR
jgi:iron complex transport system substrate-binding protein